MSDGKAPFLRSTVKVVHSDAGPLRVTVKTEPRKPIKMIVPVYTDDTPVRTVRVSPIPASAGVRTVKVRRIIPE